MKQNKIIPKCIESTVSLHMMPRSWTEHQKSFFFCKALGPYEFRNDHGLNIKYLDTILFLSSSQVVQIYSVLNKFIKAVKLD